MTNRLVDGTLTNFRFTQFENYLIRDLPLNLEKIPFKEAGLLDESGKLTAKALECVNNKRNLIKKGVELGNPQVIARLTKNGESIENWGKYRTQPVLVTGDNADIHFYYNNKTGEVVTDIDFKVKGGFGLKGNDVSIFEKKPIKEPISQKDPCHNKYL